MVKHLIITFVAVLLFTFTAFGQELPKDFSFDKEGEGKSVTYKLLPSGEKMLSDVKLGLAFQSIGVISLPEQDKFGLVFVNAQPEFQFDKAEGKPFVLLLGSGDTNRITGSNVKVFSRSKVKKLKIEMLAVELSRADYEQFINAANVTIAYGSINYEVAPSNLQAFRYLRARIAADVAERTNRPTTAPSNPTYQGGEVQVKGYYRKDGTYVKPHSRKRKD